jgi:hypothetical protein
MGTRHALELAEVAETDLTGTGKIRKWEYSDLTPRFAQGKPMSLYDMHYAFYVAGYEGRRYPIDLRTLSRADRRAVRKAHAEGVHSHHLDEIFLRHMCPRSL